MTNLHKFTQAYARMTVAVYEPLILHWYSSQMLSTLASIMAVRLDRSKRSSAVKGAPSTLHRLLMSREETTAAPSRTRSDIRVQDIDGGLIPKEQMAVVEGGIRVGDTVYTHGLVNAIKHGADRAPAAPIPRALPFRNPALEPGDAALPLRTLPVFANPTLGSLTATFDFRKTVNQLNQSLFQALADALKTGKRPGKAILDALKADNTELFQFLPAADEWDEGLSPVGLIRLYRQLYFNADEGYGPIEQAITVAPMETLELVEENVRRQTQEEVVEVGLETVSETAVETRDVTEVSDKVSTMVQRDASAAMSAETSGFVGVWSVDAAASGSVGISSSRSQETAARRLKEVTKRASERISRSFSVRTRTTTDVTTSNVRKRTVRNETAQPVSYGLRRVLRRVRVKIQDLGPRLVWQLYLENPGAGLIRSRFVQFRESEPLGVPENPPGVRPRPQGGTDTGTATATVNGGEIPIRISAGPDRAITAVSIDSLQDMGHGTKHDQPVTPRNDVPIEIALDVASSTYVITVSINASKHVESVQANYTYSYDPSPQVLAEWEAERQAAVNSLTQDALERQFQRQKQLITERSKIRPRPANDLRREERFEIMRRLVGSVFSSGDNPSNPSPLEIEYFNRYFDIEGMFVITHPSWWRPRVARNLQNNAYQITSESDPAPMGSSLGWLLQLDGDTRRNEFLNSPWARVCLPIHPHTENEALAWLASHIEGNLGYNPSQAPLQTLLQDIQTLRTNQDALGVNGPEYVSIDSTVGAPPGPLSPEQVFPVIDEFEVTVPTEGFIYDVITTT